MKRMHIVQLFGLMNQLPTDAEFEVEPPNNYDEVLVRASSDSTGQSARWTLGPAGCKLVEE